MYVCMFVCKYIRMFSSISWDLVHLKKQKSHHMVVLWIIHSLVLAHTWYFAAELNRKFGML